MKKFVTFLLVVFVAYLIYDRYGDDIWNYWHKRTPEVRLAPQGTFYMIEYVSLKTPTGVIGFEPGHEVRLVSVDEATRKLIVTDGHYKMPVTPFQVTNNLDVADLARRTDQTSQAAIAAFLEAQRKIFERDQRTMAIQYSEELEKVNAKLREGIWKRPL